jgi:Ca-activated chloride channel family protein
MKTILSLLFLISSTVLFGQAMGWIKGTVTDAQTGEGVPFVKVKLLNADSTLIGGVISDVDGVYVLNALNPGAYILSFESIEHKHLSLRAIVNSEKITFQDVKLEKEVIELEEVRVMASMQILYVPGVQVASMQLRGSRGRYKESSINTESYGKIDENTFTAVKFDPLSTFSIDVDRASYSNVRRFLEDLNLPPIDAVRIEEMVNYFPYHYPAPSGDIPFTLQTEYTECPWNTAHQLVKIGMHSQDIDASKAAPNNLVFLIDVSGSMASDDKLPLLKKGLYLLIDQLREEDKVSIVVYAGAAGVVLTPTSGMMKDKIKAVIEKLESGGSTAGGEGIELAYSIAKSQFITNGNNRIILATDGDFNVGVSSEGDLIRLIEDKREQGIFLSVLGFGTGNLQDSKMEKLADRGNGNYNYIDNMQEAKKVLVEEMGGTLITVAKDVKLQVEFNPNLVKGYRLIGYENRSLEDDEFNNDKIDAGDLGAGHTVTAFYELIPAGSTEVLPGIDSLKYQSTNTPNGQYGNEIMTIKVRYKAPNGVVSKLFSLPVNADIKPFNSTSADMQFAASVVEFGLLLRSSSFKGNASFQHVIETAQNALGDEKNDYRAEFVRLVRIAESLTNKR